MTGCRGCCFYKGERRVRLRCFWLLYTNVQPHFSIRSADDEDVFPDELKVPLGRADHMLDDAAIVPVVDVSDDPKTQEESSSQQEVPDTPALVSLFPGM